MTVATRGANRSRGARLRVAWEPDGAEEIARRHPGAEGNRVLAVLAYHAQVGVMAGGYFGVDVFFVISEFLMTRMIAERMESQRFSFRDFYFRRARRQSILGAAR